MSLMCEVLLLIILQVTVSRMVGGLGMTHHSPLFIGLHEIPIKEDRKRSLKRGMEGM